MVLAGVLMKCLDTYALVEIHDGNPKFVHLLSEEIIITDITLAEFYGVLYKRYGKLTAEYWNKKLDPFCRAVSRQTLLQAAAFRIENNQQNLSFFDCVGYMFSLENNYTFVTGDKEFEKKKGVELLKK